jgi:hypothetical protein
VSGISTNIKPSETTVLLVGLPKKNNISLGILVGVKMSKTQLKTSLKKHPLSLVQILALEQETLWKICNQVL